MDAVEKLNVAVGYVDVEAKFIDGSSRVIRVRALPVRHHGAFLARCIDEASVIEFTCVALPGSINLDDGWSDGLSDDSVAMLADKARELNFRRATATLERQIAVAEKLKPLNERAKILQT